MLNYDQTRSEGSGRLTRRQLIRRGMAVGGVALWSSPLVVLGLRHSNGDKPDPAPQENSVVPLAQTVSCFVEGSGPGCMPRSTFCGTGPSAICICETDAATGNCVCIQAGTGDFIPCGPGNPCGPGRACGTSGSGATICFPLCPPPSPTRP